MKLKQTLQKYLGPLLSADFSKMLLAALLVATLMGLYFVLVGIPRTQARNAYNESLQAQ